MVISIVWILLAIVSVVYGIIVRSSGSGTGFFIVWILLALFFAAAFVLSIMHIWAKIPKPVKIIFYALIGIVLTSFVVIEGFVVSNFNKKGKDNLDYVIVLGAQVYENGPSRVLKYRLDKALDYLNENPSCVCIVSGGKGDNEPFSEAEGMAEYLENNGIEESRIIIENQSENTEQNIENSMRYIEDGASVGIITNNFHMFRALQIAKSKGLTNVCGISAGSTGFYLPNNMLREYFSEIKFLIFK